MFPSTPKRRRLSAERFVRPSQFVNFETNILTTNSSIDPRTLTRVYTPSEGCDSPPLPCNQIEFLSDSWNNSTTSSTVPCSRDVLDCSILKDIANWESLTEAKNNVSKNVKEHHEIVDIFEDITDNMFCTKLEQNASQNNAENIALRTKSDKSFINNIEETFDTVNKSICGIQNEKLDLEAEKPLFDTQDSILLNIEESEIVKNEIKNNVISSKEINVDNFYGLPVITKSLFKTYRNIEKFYDWQEECLNLGAITERQNLIYALPTSGGKTLVAEILMLREVLNRKKNAIFILPFVALVQEKIWSLSPFALQLEFLVEEYAAGKGHIPPKKRRKKNSIYIATIEKGLSLIRSLIELDRLNEIGLIVVDELHLIGEPGRGATLETLLSTVIFTNQGIQIVGMSATIGNLPDIARFLHAQVYERQFRPVELHEYVKLDAMLYRILWGPGGLELVPDRQLAFDYSSAATALDPDLLGGLVSEVVPEGSCLVFCPTKRNCENVAALLCKLQRREMLSHRSSERGALVTALRRECATKDLVRFVRYGVAYHHAGLASDERAMLEHAFRSGVISVLCCTSTLAAGVNLPARRVIIRAPYVGLTFMSLASYRQMVGRAGRAGVCDTGESILICNGRQWPQARSMLCGGLPAIRSALRDASSASGLLLSAVALRLATTRAKLRKLLECTLMAVAPPEGESSEEHIKSICDESLRSLMQSGVLEVVEKGGLDPNRSRLDHKTCIVYNDSELSVSKLGRAAIKGGLDLTTAKQLLEDLETASRGLVVMGGLHLLYLVTPHDAAGVRPDYTHYYTLYSTLDEEGLQTARILGITEVNAVRMVTGNPITNVPEKVLCRFYLALMLHDLWKQMPFPLVANKYNVQRGTVQAVMTSSAAFASSAHRFCEELAHLWPHRALLAELAGRLQHCAAPELHQLMELPAVKKARALQLMRAGYKRIEDLAKASVDELVSSLSHLSRPAATHLVSAARMMLIEKVENLRAEAEDVMEELNAKTK